MPARNERDRLVGTLRSIAETRAFYDYDLEIVIVDDASEDGCCSNLAYHADKLHFPRTSLRVRRLHQRQGVPRARNEGAMAARGDILFITDAHVQFCPGWDRYLFENLKETTILAATTTDPESAFKAYGCTLAVPFMGTFWVRERPSKPTPVQIAACHGTILSRALFHKIGGYDAGMIYYSAAEPEFSVRAWLSGAEILSIPELEVAHRFKPKPERTEFLQGLRPYMIHNSFRFGILYLSEAAILQMIRYFSIKFPRHVHQALQLLNNSDVWKHRRYLQEHLLYNFEWFIAQFRLKNQVGQEIVLM